jgi:hypothetical protein
MQQISYPPGIVSLLAGPDEESMIFAGWYAYRFSKVHGKRVGRPANTMGAGRRKYVSPGQAGRLHGFVDDFKEALMWVIEATTDTVFYGLYYHPGPGFTPGRVVLQDDGEVVPWPKQKRAKKEDEL